LSQNLFLKQQIIKVRSKLNGIQLGIILSRAGYYHNRDPQKTEELLKNYWLKAKELGKRFMMF